MEQLLGSLYVRMELIGRGAAGYVYRGHSRADGHAVAIKLLREELLDDPQVVSRFVQERSTLLALRSDYLVQLEDLVVEGATLALVMELLPDGDLRTYLRAHGPLDLDVALRLTEEILLGLVPVHRAGIVHRDIKPANVLLEVVDGVPHAKVSDFGIARVLDAPHVTALHDYVGTPAYQAPEVPTGVASTPAADIYSVGSVLFELLTGRSPWAGSRSIAEVLHRQQTEEPALADDLPASVAGLLRALLERQPDRRPCDAHAAARAVSAVRLELGGDTEVTEASLAPSATPDVIRLPDAVDHLQTLLRSPVTGGSASPTSRLDERSPSTTAQPHRGPRIPSSLFTGRTLRQKVTAAVAALVTVVAVSLVFTTVHATNSSAAPTALLPFAPESYDDGALQVSRTWSLQGDHLHGELLLVAAKDLHTQIDEVLPKQVAQTAGRVSFTPPPSKIVRDDPVVAYQIDLKAGGSTTLRYDAPVGPRTASVALLQLWASQQYEQEEAFLVSDSSAPVPTRTLAALTLAPTSLPLTSGAEPHALGLSGTMSDGSAADQSVLTRVSWTSGAPDVATVDGSGVVTAHHDGAASVVARAGRLTAAMTVLVTGHGVKTVAAGPVHRVKYVLPPLVTAPASPGEVQALPSDGGSVAVVWSTPPNGGDAIREYTVFAGGRVVAVTRQAHAVVRGLPTGRTFTFQVSATNGFGSSPLSAPSNDVVVGATPQPVCLPPVPTAVSPAAAGSTGVRVSWTLPVLPPTCRLLGFTIASVPGSTPVPVAFDGRSATFAGLAYGTAYAFEVTAEYDGAPSQTSARSSTAVTGLAPSDAGVTLVMPLPPTDAGVPPTAPPPNGVAGGQEVQPEAVVPVVPPPDPAAPPATGPSVTPSHVAVLAATPTPTTEPATGDPTPSGDAGSSTDPGPSAEPATPDPSPTDDASIGTTPPPTTDSPTDPPPTTDAPAPTTDPPQPPPTTDPPQPPPTTDPPQPPPTTDPPQPPPTTDPPQPPPTTDPPPPTTDPPAPGSGSSSAPGPSTTDPASTQPSSSAADIVPPSPTQALSLLRRATGT